MATNNKISTVVSSQLPEFVRADHPVFVAFLQAYYEYLEQSNSTLSFGKTVERAKNIRNYFDTEKLQILVLKNSIHICIVNFYLLSQKMHRLIDRSY